VRARLQAKISRLQSLLNQVNEVPLSRHPFDLSEPAAYQKSQRLVRLALRSKQPAPLPPGTCSDLTISHASKEDSELLELLKRTEDDVIPRVERLQDRAELTELCHAVRAAMASRDRTKLEEKVALFDARVLNYAYLF
jgi:hypothetical protein